MLAIIEINNQSVLICCMTTDYQYDSRESRQPEHDSWHKIFKIKRICCNKADFTMEFCSEELFQLKQFLFRFLWGEIKIWPSKLNQANAQLRRLKHFRSLQMFADLVNHVLF